MTTEADRQHMRHALSLGRRGLGRVAPWPSVGCVLVRDGHVVGRGTSDRVTLRHAERVALDQAGALARGATAYVTLEPCSHHGTTPPCADALIAAGVARVVVAVGDPNPQVDGQGIARLRAAGIAVDVGCEAGQALADNAGFFKVQETGLPFLTLKLATSLDGRIATATGESQWITGPDARARVHAMRAGHDAVMVGGGTARIDDPMLTVRGFGPVPQPVRIVVSRFLDLPLLGNLARTASEVPVWLCHGPDAGPEIRQAWEGLGARLIPCTLSAGQLDPVDVLRALGRAGLTRVFCEGGGMLAASLLATGLVDQLVTFSAGIALGAEGQPALGVLGVARLDEAPRFALREATRCGGDVMQIWERA